MAGTKEIAQKNGLKGGRPKGSTKRPQIKDYVTEKEVKEIVESAKQKAKEGDTHLLKFLVEQIFGKAIQPMEGNLHGELIIKFDAPFTPPKTKGNS